ncbi:MAG: hypothetical protein LAO55_25010 [Acidobacteriia bacterium]|nr:hypothetical protein [Terriglobia bacterium]
MASAVSDKLGHYEIRGLIGAGGMGEVYRALRVTTRAPGMGQTTATMP